MRFLPESVRWRLTVWYAALLAIPLILFAVGSHYLLRRTLIERADAFLLDARTSFVLEFRTELSKRGNQAWALDDAIRDVRFKLITFAVFDARDSLLAPRPGTREAGEVLDVRDHLVMEPSRILRLRDAAASSVTLSSLAAPDTSNRVAIGPVTVGGNRYTVAAIQVRHDIAATLSRLTLAYTIGVPLFLLFANAGGYVLARRALAPVAQMSRQARAIGASNLHERLPVPRQQDELRELAMLINELLQRLEGSFDQQRRFVANASHELRTPVAIVRAESEIALGRDGRAETEYRESLGIVHDASARMSSIVNDLFMLARADAGNMPVRKELIYLDEMVAEVARSMRGVASQQNVSIEIAELRETPFTGDLELLRRMLLNLIDNAVKYSPSGSTVRVRLTRENGRHMLSVVDQGQGIPPEAQPHVFERFYRVDKARGRSNAASASGAGLGLSIVELVAQMHGGCAMLAHSSDAGSEFVVELPATN